MSELTYIHGDGATGDYPEHVEWLVPDLLKLVNKLTAGFNVYVFDIDVHAEKYQIEFKIRLDKKEASVRLDYTKYGTLKELITSLIDSINDLCRDAFKDFPITVSFPNDSRTTLSLENSDVKKFEDLKIKRHSKKVEGDYYLPFYSEEESVKQTIEVLEEIASLNPDNNVQFEITSMTTEDATIVFYSPGKRKSVHLRVLDFDLIGNELNEFLTQGDYQFVLIQPDEDSLLYAFCPPDERDLLERHSFVVRPRKSPDNDYT